LPLDIVSDRDPTLVESFKLDDYLIFEEEKAKMLTAVESYFQLAESYI